MAPDHDAAGHPNPVKDLHSSIDPAELPEKHFTSDEYTGPDVGTFSDPSAATDHCALADFDTGLDLDSFTDPHRRRKVGTVADGSEILSTLERGRLHQPEILQRLPCRGARVRLRCPDALDLFARLDLRVRFDYRIVADPGVPTDPGALADPRTPTDSHPLADPDIGGNFGVPVDPNARRDRGTRADSSTSTDVGERPNANAVTDVSFSSDPDAACHDPGPVSDRSTITDDRRSVE